MGPSNPGDFRQARITGYLGHKGRSDIIVKGVPDHTGFWHQQFVSIFSIKTYIQLHPWHGREGTGLVLRVWGGRESEMVRVRQMGNLSSDLKGLGVCITQAGGWPHNIFLIARS